MTEYDNLSPEDWQSLSLTCQSLRDSLNVFEEILKHRPEVPARIIAAENSAREIRDRHDGGGESFAKLALSYGVSKDTISRLIAHVPSRGHTS